MLWEQRGATSIAPPAIAIAVLLAGICTEALRYAYLARQHRIVRSVRRAPSRYKALRAALPCLRSACQLAWGIGSGVGFFFLCVWLSRTQSGEHLDDLHPTDGCSFLPEYRTHDHARFLWLIPIHDGVRMSADRSWCEEMMRLERDEGMALGMHGVLHQMRWRKDNATGKWVGKREFEDMPLERARKRVALGVEVWKEAFNGSAPRHFSFPGQWGSAAIVEMLEKDPNLRVVFKEYPILSPESKQAAKAAIAADRQGKYFEMHNALMASRGSYTDEQIMEIAAEVGLDTEQLAADMDSAETEAVLAENMALASELGINGTPTFIVRDTLVPGAMDLETMKHIIEEARASS